MHDTTDVPADHRAELLAEVLILEPLVDELDERVDRDQRVLDLVGDARDDAREELELVRLALFGGEGLLRRQILEHQRRAERAGPVLRPYDRGTERQDADQLATGGERHGDDGLQKRERPRDVGLELAQPGRSSVTPEPLQQARVRVELNGIDDGTAERSMHP